MQHTAIFNGCKNDNFKMIFFKYFSSFFLLKIWIVCIGHFQSIKTDVLKIFSFITGDKTGFLSQMMFSN